MRHINVPISHTSWLRTSPERSSACACGATNYLYSEPHTKIPHNLASATGSDGAAF